MRRQAQYCDFACLLLAFLPVTLGQKEAAGGEVALAANMKKFQEGGALVV